MSRPPTRQPPPNPMDEVAGPAPTGDGRPRTSSPEDLCFSDKDFV